MNMPPCPRCRGFAARPMRVLVLFLVLVLVPLACLAAPGTAAAPDGPPPADPLRLAAADRMIPLSGRLGLYYDAANLASIETLTAGAGADPFRPLPHDLALGYVRGTAWLRLTLLRPAGVPAEWWLEVRRPGLDEVVLYRPDPGGGWTAETLGDQTPWAQRALRSRNSVFLLDLPSAVPCTLYLRIRSTSNLSTTFWLWRPTAYAGANGLQLALYGGFALAACVIVLIGLGQAVALRDRLHLIYAVYVLVLATYIVSTEGLVQVLLNSPRVIHLESFISLLLPGVPALAALLTRDLLQLRHYAPRLDRLYYGGAWLVIAVGVLAVPGGFDVALKPWLWGLVLLELPLNCGLALWLAWRGVRAARFYLAAFGVLSLTSVWSLLAALGLSGGRAWSHEITVLGSLVHMVLMQLTVADQVYSAKRAHDAARERALRAEQLATSRLDEEVARRTKELRQALCALESTSAQLAAAKETTERTLSDQRQLTAMLSHELRNPLASIDAAAQLLALRHGGDESVAGPAGRIRRGALRARHFLQNCLTAERIAADCLTLNARPVDLARLIRAVLDAAEPTGPQRLRLEAPAVLPSLDGDPDLLEVLLLNLVENALKYAPPETPVVLAVTVADDRVRFAVQDQGPGIPLDEQALVFEKYRRGRQTGGVPGAGLGLALAARICELHQGRLELDSAPGRGTCITVILPLSPPPEFAP